MNLLKNILRFISCFILWCLVGVCAVSGAPAGAATGGGATTIFGGVAADATPAPADGATAGGATIFGGVAATTYTVAATTYTPAASTHTATTSASAATPSIPSTPTNATTHTATTSTSAATPSTTHHSPSTPANSSTPAAPLSKREIEDSLDKYESIIISDTLSAESALKIIDKCLLWANQIKDEYRFQKFISEKSLQLFHQEKYKNSIELLEQQGQFLEGKLKKTSKKERVKWEELHVKNLGHLGFSQTYFGLEEESIKTYNYLMEKYGKDSLSLASGGAYNGMGVTMSFRRHWTLAQSYFKKALAAYEKCGYVRGIYTSSSNLGGVLLELGKPQEALFHFLEAQKIVIKEGYKGNPAIYTSFNLGSTYNALGKLVIADKYFSEALQMAKDRNIPHLILRITLSYAYNLLNQNKIDQALAQTYMLVEHANETNQIQLEIMGRTLLSQIYVRKEEYKKATDEYASLISLKDSVFNSENEDRLLALKFEFDNYKILQERKLEEMRSTRRNWIILSLAILSIGAFFVIFFLLKEMRKEKLINNITEEELNRVKLSSKEELESVEKELGKEIETKAKELTSNSMLMLKFVELVPKLEDKVKNLKVNFMLRSKERKTVEEIEDILKEFAPTKELNEFKIYFEQVDRDFFKKLDAKYPNLTPNEKRLCALIHLNLNSKEIACLTSRTFQSIGTMKFRLKKKMNLSEDINLYEVMASL